MKTHDYEHRYQGYFGCDSRCRIRVYDGAGELTGDTVVIATELDDNEGTSVTNVAEQLATDIAARHAVRPGRLIWIEHYPADPALESDEEFSLVVFDEGERGGLREPRWSHLEKEAAEAMVGEPIC